jgi:hypothetical protein
MEGLMSVASPLTSMSADEAVAAVTYPRNKRKFSSKKKRCCAKN